MVLNVYSERIDQTWYAVALDGTKVVATSFARVKGDALKGVFKSLPYEVPFEAIKRPSEISKEVSKAMDAILDGRDVSFNFELDMTRVPRTTRQVLELMSLIPTGYVATYGGLAKVLGTGPRVAGHACATNPFPPIIPCHRVVAVDLSLGGYGGGLKPKWRILRREDRGFRGVSNVQIKGKLLPLFPISRLRPPLDGKC
jgi:O-6-methylguanine DNA methyltransferase